MTNKDKWMLYTEGLASPQNYIEWGYRFLISSCLQRRVWCPPDHKRCYPNMYPVLIGKAGVGKGNVIQAVQEVLRFHKLKDAANDMNGSVSPEQKMMADATVKADIEAAGEIDKKMQVETDSKKTAPEFEPLLIPMAPNATTYEALTQTMSRNTRRIDYQKKDGQWGLYSHCSLCATLEEMGSLFRKNTQDIVTFIQQAYDCSDTYEYFTKNKNKDRILRMCLNMMAGTTPDFIKQVFNDGLLNQGMSSRMFCIYAEKNRKTQFFIPALTPEQEQARNDIIKYVKGLTRLYGQVIIDDKTIDFLQLWLMKFEANPNQRINKSPKLEHYYARMNIHIMKVAMAIHFGETYDMHIPQERFEEAIEILQKEERTMHLGLAVDDKNPLAGPSIEIYNHLKSNGKKTQMELLVDFWGKVRDRELQEILEFLVATGQVESQKGIDEVTLEAETYFRTKE